MMASLRGKASRFFRDSPTPDEKAANEDNPHVGFGAGIQDAEMKKKPSLFFGRKNDRLDKTLPEPPNSSSSSSTLLAPVANRATTHDHSDSFDQLPDYDEDQESPQHSSASSIPPTLSNDRRTSSGLETSSVKPRSSFAALKEKASRLFGSKNSSPTHTPPPPPVPQIPINVAAPKPRRPVLGLLPKTCNWRSTLTESQGRNVSISRPQLVAQLCNPLIPENTSTVPFEKRAGPPPPRPTRPNSLDNDTLAFMRESGTRMVLSTNKRGSTSTAAVSTPRSQASSIEARLGFPSGHGTPRSSSLESPLAARFNPGPSPRLPICDSSGNLVYRRFSEYVEYKGQGMYVLDGVDAEDREIGPIELFRASKRDDWTLEKRVSGGADGKRGGMLFRDRWGGFHFVADI